MALKLFRGDEAQSPIHRFISFIEWGQPFGTAGINSIHSNNFNIEDPWFEYSTRFTPHGRSVCRSWLLKYEHVSRKVDAFRIVRKSTTVEILDRSLFIAEGTYLSFAKTYINVISHYRNIRSHPKALIPALIILEYALRAINNGENSPELITPLVFEKAVRILCESDYNHGTKYDIGKELECLAGMLTTGYNTTSFRFHSKGLRLLTKRITLKSPIPNRPRRKTTSRNVENLKSGDSSRLTNEEITAFGLCYQKALIDHGSTSTIAFYASIIGLSLTTVSMRVSEAITLNRNALYPDELSNSKRYRIKVTRPKNGEHQDIPIPLKLSNLANDQFNLILDYTNEAHNALSYYVENFGNDFSSIDNIYIPTKYQHLFDKEYLTREDVNTILEIGDQVDARHSFPQRLRSINVYRFIDVLGDTIYEPSATASKYKYLKISTIEKLCSNYCIKTFFPDDFKKCRYMKHSEASKYTNASSSTMLEVFRSASSAARNVTNYIKSSDLYQHLLKEFKRMRFPHWPYLTKEKSTRVDEALLVWFAPDNSHSTKPGQEKGKWWLPTPISAATINTWINRQNGQPGILFRVLGIKLSNGSYPSLTLHQTRKYHQTSALLAGANEAFIDKLAGRQTGRQSDHYDLRTPHEIVSQSIELFDPDSDFEVIGPVANDAPDPSNVVERKVFLYEHAAPKQITEVGGCRSDWSLNPCEQYGDCMRCDKSIWRKGDQKRLPFIKELHGHALNMITLAEDKIRCGNDLASIRKHLQQNRETLKRCEAILAAEDNPSIKVGTIVTFDAPDTAFSTSQLTQRLYDQHCCKDSE